MLQEHRSLPVHRHDEATPAASRQMVRKGGMIKVRKFLDRLDITERSQVGIALKPKGQPPIK
jgi:hypothetical protein